MTVGSAVSCASCATPVRAGTPVCPRCASPVAPPLADLPLLLDGCVPASAGARGTARLVDALLVLLPVGGGLAAGALLPAARGAAFGAGVVVAVLVAAALVAAYGRSGRTPGHAVTGTRAVDVVTGLAPRAAGGPSRWGGDTVLLDIRAGRDPVTTSSLRGAAPTLEAPAAVTAGYQARPAPVASAPAFLPAPPPVPTRARHADPGPVPGVIHAPPQPAPARPQAVPAPAPSQARTTVGGAQVRLDDGRSVVVSGVTLVGRNPAPAPGDPHVDLLPLPDLTRSVSKTHAVLRWDGRDLRVTDRGSTNGTLLETPGRQVLLPAGTETVAPVGSRIVLGDRVLTVEGIVT